MKSADNGMPSLYRLEPSNHAALWNIDEALRMALR